MMMLLEEVPPEHGSIEVTAFPAAILQSWKLPDNRCKHFARLVKFVHENPKPIANNDQIELSREVNRLAGSNYDHLLSNPYVPNPNYHLSGISD